MVGIQVGNEQEERKGEEKRMIRENIGNSLSRAMRETTSAAATLTTRRSKCSCSSAERERERDDMTESQLLQMLGLESIQLLIRKTKLQRVAHCTRRGK